MVCFDKIEILHKILTLESKGFILKEGGECSITVWLLLFVILYFNQLLKVLSIPSPRVALKNDKSDIQFTDFHNIITDFLS